MSSGVCKFDWLSISVLFVGAKNKIIGINLFSGQTIGLLGSWVVPDRKYVPLTLFDLIEDTLTTFQIILKKSF